MKSLAVKYRPQTTSKLVGQHQAKEILQNIFTSGNVPSSILIKGETGCGKTTIARILSRTINCKNQTGCGKCISCKLFDNNPDSHSDYLEINAGSERGIDKIRQLVDVAKYSPMFRHRFICLDECHQISGAAGSALLKPLEEPREKTTWILATTNPEKLLKTIVNRCITIQVGPVDSKDLSKHLKHISKKEGFKLSSKYANKIAEYSGGFVRDSMSVLETLIRSSSKGKDIGKDISKAFYESNDMELATSAAGVLIGLYEGSDAVVVSALADVQDFVGLTNKMTYMNGHLIYAITKSMDSKIKNPYFYSFEVRKLMDAMRDDLKKDKSKIFKRALKVTTKIDLFRGKLLTTSMLDPRSVAISIFAG